jgi:hypothetical protein
MKTFEIKDMYWRPIETAPATPVAKDSDPETFIAWVENGGSDGNGLAAIGWAWLTKDGEIFPAASGYGVKIPYRITHWMPLPRGPQK